MRNRTAYGVAFGVVGTGLVYERYGGLSLTCLIIALPCLAFGTLGLFLGGFVTVLLPFGVIALVLACVHRKTRGEAGRRVQAEIEQIDYNHAAWLQQCHATFERNHPRRN